MNKEQFHQLHSRIPSATSTTGQPLANFPAFIPPTPVERLQTGILQEHRTWVNSELSWSSLSTFFVQKILHHPNTSGTNYYCHSCQAYL